MKARTTATVVSATVIRDNSISCNNSNALTNGNTDETTFSGSGRTSGSQTPPDLSILRKPIQTSVTGFHEVVRAYECGTDEIRKLLANECDLIYECKVCRNIFRSLVNYISHKRIYCKSTFNSSHHFHFRDDGCFDQDSATIIQPSDPDDIQPGAAGTNGPNNNNNKNNPVKDLSSIIDRLCQRKQTARSMTLNDFYDQANQKVAHERKQQKSHILQLDRLATSKAAVFQTVIAHDPEITDVSIMESIKQEVTEVYDLNRNDCVMLGPDGKSMEMANTIKMEDVKDEIDVKPDQVETVPVDSASINNKCKLCNSSFGTEKTLKLHIKAKHTPSTYVFPCPCCSQTFMQTSAVIRHLSNDHKKSMKRIRLMREAIVRRRIRIDEVQVKGPNRELARLQQDAARERYDALQRTNWPDNYSGNGELLPDKSSIFASLSSSATAIVSSVCTFCGKSFERRAALISHIKTCPQKIAGVKIGSTVSMLSSSSSSSCTATTRSVAGQSDENSNNGSLKLSFDRIIGDDDSSSSVDNFMAMLNREKQIQAEVQEKDEQMIAAAAEATTNTNCDILKLKSIRSDISTENQDNLVALDTHKNKRKRTRVRKSAPEVNENGADFSWTIDEDISMSITVIKPDPDSIDSAINSVVTNSLNETELDEPDSAPSSPDIKPDQPVVHKGKKGRLISDLEKTTDCTICDKKFANISNLRRHVSMFHYREKKFGCKWCQFKAFRKVDVVNHLTTAHSSVIGDKEEAAKFVILLEIDKNKFNDEKVKAIGDALEKLKEKQQDCTIDMAEEELMDDGSDVPADIIIPLMCKEDLDESVTAVLDDMIPLDDVGLKEEDVIPVSGMNGSTTVVEMIDMDEILPSTKVTFIKRRGRPKIAGNTRASRKFHNPRTPNTIHNITVPPSRPTKATKLIRHSSTEEIIQKRPVRNRIKTVKQDFVYDLSNLLKKEAEAYKEQQMTPILLKAQKRKLAAIINSSAEDISKEISSLSTAASTVVTDESDMMSSQPKRNCDEIRGAAMAMAQMAVQQMRACFNKPPELPAERPIVPAKIISMRRSENSTLDPIKHSEVSLPMETMDDKALLRRTSNEKLFDALTKKKQMIDLLNRTQSMTRNGVESDSNEILLNNDSTPRTDVGSDDEKIVVTCATELEFQQYLIANQLAPPSISLPPPQQQQSLPYLPKPNKVSSLQQSLPLTAAAISNQNLYGNGGVRSTSPTSPSQQSSYSSMTTTNTMTSPTTKRITLMQRLAENKTKKMQESLMRLNVAATKSNTIGSRSTNDHFN